MQVEGERVTALAHTALSGWAIFPRLADDPV
jgi:hypothetical protein